MTSEIHKNHTNFEFEERFNITYHKDNDFKKVKKLNIVSDLMSK